MDCGIGRGCRFRIAADWRHRRRGRFCGDGLHALVPTSGCADYCAGHCHHNAVNGHGAQHGACFPSHAALHAANHRMCVGCGCRALCGHQSVEPSCRSLEPIGRPRTRNQRLVVHRPHSQHCAEQHHPSVARR